MRGGHGGAGGGGGNVGAEEVLSVESVVWEELGGLVQHPDRPVPASDPASGNPPLGVCSHHAPGDSPGL